MFPESTYDQKQLQLGSGDRLFVHTDGLTDAFNPAGQQFGEDRLQAVLAEAGDETLFDLKQRVLAAVRSHTGGSLGHDDVTLMAMEVN
jgi:sigma-B regulation protein RsbU (phosphoserine phosphatase)